MTRNPVIVFDGRCNFCNGAVHFVIKRDPRARFHFTPMQSPLARKLMAEQGVDTLSENTLVLIKAGRCHIWSDAALEIAGDLDGCWRLCKGFRIIPRPIRDFVYRLFARHRYALFGRTDTCMVPSPEVRSRFIGLEA